MKYLLILLFLVSCAKPKDGSNGADGVSGPNGLNGTNGTDNHIIQTVNCNGQISTAGYFSGIYISYNYALTTYGDVYVSQRFYGIGSYNNGSSMVYSYNQNGSISGAISTAINDSVYISSKLNENKKIVISFKTTTNHDEEFIDKVACELNNY